jgi:flagellar protein FliS
MISNMGVPNPASAYREATCLGATPVGMVVLLYDRLVLDIHRAVAALDAGDIESRATHVNHALLILQQLQGTLDFQQGAATARQLDNFYSVLRGKLVEAQMRQSRELMLQASARDRGSAGVLGTGRVRPVRALCCCEVRLCRGARRRRRPPIGCSGLTQHAIRQHIRSGPGQLSAPLPEARSPLCRTPKETLLSAGSLLSNAVTARGCHLHSNCCTEFACPGSENE